MIPLVSVAVVLMLVNVGLLYLVARNVRGTQVPHLPPLPPPTPDSVLQDVQYSLARLKLENARQAQDDDRLRMVLDTVMQSQERGLAAVADAITKSISVVQLLNPIDSSTQGSGAPVPPPTGYLQRWSDAPEHATDLSDPSDRFIPPPRRPDQVYLDPNDPGMNGDDIYGVPGLTIDREQMSEAFEQRGMQVPNA